MARIKKRICSETAEDTDYGKRLKQEMLAAGCSQSILAKRLGVTRQTVSNWQNGKTHCSYKQEIQRILESLRKEKAARDPFDPFEYIPTAEDSTISRFLRDYGIDPFTLQEVPLEERN